MKISYLEFGEKGQNIVFLHGWQQDKKSFSPLVPFLFKKYRLFLVDLPGFGESDLTADILDSFDFAKVVTNWLKKRKIKKVILIGHSFGGKVASIIAKKEPQLIYKLILIANPGVSHPPKFWYPYKRFIPLFLKGFLLRFFVSRDYREAGKLLPLFKTIVKENLEPVFADIKIPTLLIWGKNDQEVPIADGIKINHLIKKSQLIVLDGGHFPFWEDPQKVADLIDKFIQNDRS